MKVIAGGVAILFGLIGLLFLWMALSAASAGLNIIAITPGYYALPGLVFLMIAFFAGKFALS